MRTDSLFSELVLRLASHPENIATEALAYILKKYPHAWTPLRAWLELAGTQLPESLAFSTQVSHRQDSAIPDLVGTDADVDQVLVIEAKFWAELTPNQPATYVRRLRAGKPGMVLVIAPALRYNILWQKLVQNCTCSEINVGKFVEPSSELRSAQISEDHTLALTSWRALLTVLLREAEIRGDSDLIGDIEQLAGLCSRMDSTEFLPLTESDTSRQIGQRIQHYADLVDRSVAILVQEHGASVSGLSTGGTQSTYGRFFLLNSVGFFLAFSPPLWAQYGETPIWLRVTDGQWTATHELKERLAAAFADRPNRVCEKNGSLYVGISLPVGVELVSVCAEVIAQVAYAAERCAQAS